MRMSLVALFLFAVVAPAPAAEGLIFLKDGTVLQGNSRQQTMRYADSLTKEVYDVPSGYFFVDDGVRRFFFSHHFLANVDEKNFVAPDAVRWDKKVIFPGKNEPLAPVLEILKAGTFDEKWDRSLEYRGPMTMNGPVMVKVNEHLSQLTPFSARTIGIARLVGRVNYESIWSAGYVTSELGIDFVKRTLLDHPDFKDSRLMADKQRIARQIRLAYFLLNAGWLDEAEGELERISREFKDAGPQIEEAKEKIRKVRVQRHHEDIVRANNAGRRQFVTAQAPLFSEKFSTPKALAEVRKIKESYDAADAKLKEIQAFLKELPDTVDDSKDLFKEAAAAILQELHPDHLARLEVFLRQAKQAERQKKTKGKADESPAEILSLAVTGWLLGETSAETKTTAAHRAWRGRKLVYDYLRLTGEGDRVKLIAGTPDREMPSADEMLQIVSLMPPPEPEAKLPEGIAQQTIGNGTYLLQLPLEYTHARSYPVLIVLHNAGEEPRAMIDRWAERARQEGYILVAPSWQQGPNSNYGYTPAEHEVVTQTLHDLRRRFNVNSDRVFLFGLGQGGTMAFDVGLSHPDLFAGVLPMCGIPEFYCRKYLTNGLYLPFYVVSGELMGVGYRANKELFEKWVPKGNQGYPSIHIQYRGRGSEWFGGELPAMFDWMSRKKRTVPVTELGRFGAQGLGSEFSSMRQTDNRFYWISAEGIDPARVAPQQWNNGHFPATLSAIVNPGMNQVLISQNGYKQLTLWLARDAGLTFDKVINVRVNGILKANNLRVLPSVSTLLEDFSQRLDRQRLYLAKIDLK